MKARAPVLGGNFGVWGGLFSTYDCAVKGYVAPKMIYHTETLTSNTGYGKRRILGTQLSPDFSQEDHLQCEAVSEQCETVLLAALSCLLLLKE